MKKTINAARGAAALVLILAAALSCGKKTDVPLVSAITDLNGKFSPFSGESNYDIQISDLVLGKFLCDLDRMCEIVYQGIEGEKRMYNGKEYLYTGIADTSVAYDNTNDTTSYRFKLREGVKFSDGVELTADDVIFTFYVYCDPAYIGSQMLGTLPILGVDAYRNKKADFIEGIRRLGMYEVEVVIKGIDASAIWRLAVAPAPRHHYGKTELYNYDEHQFGFPFGDLSSIYEKDGEPLGAGPYKFVKFDNKVVYLEANEFYWEGAPQTKYLQFKITNPSDEVTSVTTGAADISTPSNSKERIAEIKGYNKNGELSGDVLTTSSVSFAGYGYIGLNAKNISVGGNPASAASKNLRKALAVALAVYRDFSVDSFYGEAASVLNYPITTTSWASPRPSDPDYRVAFSRDVTGGDIYTAEMSAEERYAAAEKAALGFFEAAGYTLNSDKTKVTAAPAGAQLRYEVMLGSSGSGDHPSFLLLVSAKESLERIGVTLDIQDVDFSVLMNTVKGGTAQLWVMAWGNQVDPDMYQVYHSSNVIGKGASSNQYMIADAELDRLIIEGRRSFDTNYRRGIYHAALEVILDWGIEVPVYQRQECTLFSTKRINIATLPADMTTYRDWKTGIHTLEMR